MQKNEKGSVSMLTSWSGSGSELDPYGISNESHLKELDAEVESGEQYADCYFRLEQSLTLASETWAPIGNSSNAFCGHFDGNGKEIAGLNVVPGKPSGLFAEIGSGGSVTNLKVTGTVNAKLNGGSIGLLCGINNGLIRTCDCTADVTVADEATFRATSTYVGIVTGINNNTITDCKVAGKIAAILLKEQLEPSIALYAGGIAGLNMGLICDATVTIAVNDRSKQLTAGKFPVYVNALCGINGTGAKLLDCVMPTIITDGQTAEVIYIRYAINTNRAIQQNCERQVIFKNTVRQSQVIIDAGEQVSIFRQEKRKGEINVGEDNSNIKLVNAVVKMGKAGTTYESNYPTMIFEENGCMEIYGNALINIEKVINHKEGYTDRQYEFKFFGDNGAKGQPGQAGQDAPEPNHATISIGTLDSSIKVVSVGGNGGNGGNGGVGGLNSDGVTHAESGQDGHDGKPGNSGSPGRPGRFIISYMESEKEAKEDE
jgi:hypothetical protein